MLWDYGTQKREGEKKKDEKRNEEENTIDGGAII